MSEHPVKRRRLELGLRLVDVAERVKCSKPLISMVENGYVAKLTTRERIAKVLESTVDELWPEGEYE